MKTQIKMHTIEIQDLKMVTDHVTRSNANINTNAKKQIKIRLQYLKKVRDHVTRSKSDAKTKRKYKCKYKKYKHKYNYSI